MQPAKLSCRPFRKQRCLGVILVLDFTPFTLDKIPVQNHVVSPYTRHGADKIQLSCTGLLERQWSACLSPFVLHKPPREEVYKETLLFSTFRMMFAQ